MDKERVKAALAALGNSTRLQMVEIIARAGSEGTLPSTLADAVGIPRNLLGAHLLVLEKAGIVTAERQGRNRICRLEPSTLSALAKVIEAYAQTPLDRHKP
jgi:DNA-binding transcriptional ArsR family regulator